VTSSGDTLATAPLDQALTAIDRLLVKTDPALKSSPQTRTPSAA
jgi:hypothetical protein